MKTSLVSMGAKGYWRHKRTYVVNTKGQRVQKVISLGTTDKEIAEKRALRVELVWADENAVDNQGKKVWSEQGLTKLEALLNPPEDAPVERPNDATATPIIVHPKPRPPRIQVLPTAGQSLYQMFDLFTAKMMERATVDKDITARHADDLKRTIVSVQRHISDAILSTVNNDALRQMRRVITDRPQRKGQVWENHQEPEQNKISVVTVSNWLMALQMAFDFAAHRKLWIPEDAYWRENLRLTKGIKANIQSAREKADDGKPCKIHTVPELTEIYRHARPAEQMYILLGVCLGWTQGDIADFRTFHFQQINGDWFIEKPRSKTGVQGNFWCCPELATLINSRIAPQNADERMFLTQEDQPVKIAVELAWKRLRLALSKRSPSLDLLPFKTLRKLGGQLVKNVSGSHELAQTFLCQKRSDVASEHYIGLGVQIGVGKSQFERLHDVQKEIHKLVIEPMVKASLRKGKIDKAQAA